MNEHDRQADVEQRSHAIQSTRVATRPNLRRSGARLRERALGHLDPVVSRQLVEREADWSEVERAIEGHGRSTRADDHRAGGTWRPDFPRGQERRCSLYLVGNPEIASQIIAIDPRGSFYVPFRVALYDDGGPLVIIVYHRPSSFLATLGHPELSPIGELLDHNDRPASRRRRVRALNPWRR